jgi:RNA polymerase sigma-70 factor, ECF subfamily
MSGVAVAPPRVSLKQVQGEPVQKPWDVDLSVYDDEQELLIGLRRRDRLACTCLLKQFAPRLYRLSAQLMGDADEAEDVLQESFIRACDQIDSFRGESGIGSWLHRIVINTALMRLRRRQADRRAGRASVAAPDDAIDRVPDRGSAEPARQIEDDELLQHVERAVEHLPESLRVAFVLREIEGMSTRDAAAMLDISESALKVRLHRARLALRRDLAPYLSDSPAQFEGSEDA